MKRKRLSLISASLLLAALIGGLAWTVYAPTHQERLNRALIAAIKKNDTKMALTLLAEGADPNARDEHPQHLSLWRLLWDRLRGKHPDPSTEANALMEALAHRNKPLVSLLLNSGVDMNARQKVLYLLSGKGFKTQESWVSETPLMLARDIGDKQIIQMLKQAGAKE